MACTFSSFAFVEHLRDGRAPGRDQGGHVEAPQQASAVTSWSADVAAGASLIPWHECEADDARQTVGAPEDAYVTPSARDDLDSQGRTETGHAQDDLGAQVIAAPALDQAVGLGDLVIESDHLPRQHGCHGGGQVRSPKVPTSEFMAAKE